MTQSDVRNLTAGGPADPGAQGSSLADDLVWGAEGIGAEINQPIRSVYNLVATGQIPFAKMGGKLVSSRALLRAHFAARLAARV